VPDEALSNPAVRAARLGRRPGAHRIAAVLTPLIANTRLAGLLGVSRGAPLQGIEETDYSEAATP